MIFNYRLIESEVQVRIGSWVGRRIRTFVFNPPDPETFVADLRRRIGG